MKEPGRLYFGTPPRHPQLHELRVSEDLIGLGWSHRVWVGLIGSGLVWVGLIGSGLVWVGLIGSHRVSRGKLPRMQVSMRLKTLQHSRPAKGVGGLVVGLVLTLTSELPPP